MTRRSQRRGILLLIVLSLLVLFVLIGVTFVVVANQYTRSAKASAKHDVKGDNPAKELDGALYLLMRGTTDTSSLAYRHSLLGDLYGRDGFAGTVLGAGGEAGGELIRLTIQLNRPLDPNYPLPPPTEYNTNVVPQQDYFAGSVLTLVDGNSRGQSARIVRYAPATATEPAYVVVTPLESDKIVKTSFETAGFLPVTTDRFVINGKPFNGTGDGFNLELRDLTQQEFISKRPVALLPNYRQSEADQAAILLGQPRQMISMGDTDESWDAVDYQNFFLARIPTNMPPSGIPLITDPLIPSFHRPFLINYWMQDTTDPMQLWDGLPNPLFDPPPMKNRRRMVIARPMPQDHPYFTGSNAVLGNPLAYRTDLDGDGAPDDFDGDGFLDVPITLGPWDVDNDNDGTPDSIWVDLGMPAKTAPDGRLYKPLFAVLCIDLDGRLNVNAHGVREYADAVTPLPADVLVAGGGGGGTPINVTRGQGYGPAEIRIADALGAPIDVSVYERLWRTRWNSQYDVAALPAPPSPGFPGENPDPNVNWDTLSFLKQWDMPRGEYRTHHLLAGGSAYQSPSDLRGIGGVYLDLAGQPRFIGMNWTDESIDDPYETNLVTPNASDSLFTLNDQEQLLRFHDMDAMTLSGRLRSILLQSQEILAEPRLLNRFTSHSFDIPAPNILPTKKMREAKDQEDGTPVLGLHASLSDLVRARLYSSGFRTGDPDRLRKANIQVQLMLPPEIRQGQRMDLNRWLSNARDESPSGSLGHRVVDEPGETGPIEEIWTNSAYESPVRFATRNDPREGPPYNLNPNYNLPTYTRQVQARHLYCMMMLMLEHGFRFDNAPDSRIAARRVAQWAINVVDFRDPDAVMTPFEFDMEPFDGDGWGVDDDFQTTDGPARAVVWGCEQPELLITETLAFHDRRVRDTDKEKLSDEDKMAGLTAATRVPPTPPMQGFEPDEDLDQYRIPQGSLFVELYCARNRHWNNSVFPGELYDPDGWLQLGKAVGGSPVWRIAIAKPKDTAKSVLLPALPELDPQGLTSFPNDEGLIEGLADDNGLPDDADLTLYDRYVVFTTTVPTNAPTGVYYYNRGSLRNIQPGQYAVVGPYRPRTAEERARGESVTALGSKKTPRFGIDSYANQQIKMTDSGVTYQTMLGTDRTVGFTKPAVGIMVAAAITDPDWQTADPPVPEEILNGAGISVSEPLPTIGYYPPPKWGPTAPDEFKSYYGDIENNEGDVLPDETLDELEILGAEDSLGTATYPAFRVAVLQRLADPNRTWDPVTNPYISVDAQPIDLTVFSGEEDTSQENAGVAGDEAIDLSDPDPEDPYFESRERGTRTGGIFSRAPILWNPISEDPTTHPNHSVTTRNTTGDPDAYWQFPLTDTLGFLNNSYKTTRLTGPLDYIGDPAEPFPWLVWNNRPFISHLELMQVPSSAPWRLLYEFRGGNPSDLWDASSEGFTHLLNYFHSDKSGNQHPNFCRLLDYVEVPSRFAGTEKWLSPKYTASLNGLALRDLWDFEIPNNKVSMFRDPGRVNINTIPDEIVWQAIDPSQPASPTWSEVQRSLRGELATNQRPAFYGNPVRSASSADVMPLDDLEQIPVNATLLRADPTSPDRPLFDHQSLLPYDNPEFNSYFRHHKIQRLGNLVTTHSNVYAIWITVGYFEVHPWNAANPTDLTLPPTLGDPVHPDGLQLGRELGSDTGEIKRHRAFYIIDRSIPVAYEPGENHNVDKAILLRRMID